MADIEVLASADQVAERVATLLVEDLTAALEQQPTAIWGAAGGTTPAAAFDRLAAQAGSGLLWDRLRIVMGDERHVPISDEASNWGQLAERLLDARGVAASSRLVPPVELELDEAAMAYSETLAQALEEAGGRLTQLWLGLGPDGHTLSLFPQHPDGDRDDQLVIPVRNSPKPPPERLSLSLRALRYVDHCVVIGTGAAKRPVIEQALASDLQVPVAAAANVVARSGGRVTWLLDEEAAPEGAA